MPTTTYANKQLASLNFKPATREFTTFACPQTFNQLTGQIKNLIIENTASNLQEFSLINTSSGECLFIGSFNNALSFYRGILFYANKKSGF